MNLDSQGGQFPRVSRSKYLGHLDTKLHYCYYTAAPASSLGASSRDPFLRPISFTTFLGLGSFSPGAHLHVLGLQNLIHAQTNQFHGILGLGSSVMNVHVATM